MRARPILFGYSIFGLMNIFILQWLGVRTIGLTFQLDTDHIVDGEGNISEGPTAGKIYPEVSRMYQGFMVFSFILPLSGWFGTKYVYLTRPKAYTVSFKNRSPYRRDSEFNYNLPNTNDTN